jgi:hypothetical protein
MTLSMRICRGGVLRKLLWLHWEAHALSAQWQLSPLDYNYEK